MACGRPQRRREDCAADSFPLQVGIGWWLFIDGMVTGQKMNGPTTKDVAGYAWLPGVGVTIAFVMINGFDWDYMRSDANEIFSGGNVGFKARCFLFVAILLGLGCLCGSIFIMMEKYRACLLHGLPAPAPPPPTARCAHSECHPEACGGLVARNLRVRPELPDLLRVRGPLRLPPSRGRGVHSDPRRARPRNTQLLCHARRHHAELELLAAGEQSWVRGLGKQ